ncbi:KP4 killer toxin [Cladobotryum mycophilum]|uniref:KP4 killer toxin n=1 Tax=Cladobotryum mycophilum TaxID=491253 RepID=A0ABR0SQF6_9HYPO
MKSLSALVFISGASALGINCRGSGFCMADENVSAQQVMDQIGILVAQGGGDRRFYSGQQVACNSGSTGSICAFYQNGASGTGHDAFNQAKQIIDHGCRICGSVPTQPGNDVSKGQLTINYVSNPCCQGNCHC